jgi:glycosyltransferase involved in cell wall biosynthesis
MNSRNALVSIGMPVYNGEKKLAIALDSLIAQDYPNIEIIISDNGSTDRTQEICKNYLLIDSRIKYFRSEKNLGSIWNFNRVLKLSNGTYFMWAAHDDSHEKSFVSACVERLEECPEAVLCQAQTKIYIEGREELLCTNNLNSFDGIKEMVARYRETINNFPATAIYGVYRTESMRKTKLFQNCIATDMSFIQELSLYGQFIGVEKTLFTYHGREKWNTIDQDYKVFYGVNRKPLWHIPFVILFLNNFNRVINTPMRLPIKFNILWILFKHEFQQVILKILIRSLKIIWSKNFKERIGFFIYWKWMHNPNTVVACSELFAQRVIRPRLKLD